VFSSIAQDQIIAQDQAKERTTTDDSSPVVGTATGQVNGEARQGVSGWRKVMSTAMVATWLGAPSTPSLAGEHAPLVLVAEQASEDRSSVARALSEIADRYESLLFSYPAKVLEIERNASGDPVFVALLVSVDGNDNVIKRPIRQFSFEVKPDMRLIADGVQRGGTKQLAFRVAQPLQLDEEQEELLVSIVSAFKTGEDV
jgi:hypothetical protein